MSFFDELNRVDEAYIEQSPEEQKQRDKRIAFWIGICALALAPGVVVLDQVFGGIDPTCLRRSISDYFYEPVAGPVFCIVLAFVGAFLIRYRGENIWDWRLATGAGLLAFVVAAVPTDLASGFCAHGTGEIDLRPAMGFAASGRELSVADGIMKETAEGALSFGEGAKPFRSLSWLHFGSAVPVFLILFYFVTFAFPRKRESDFENGTLLKQKTIRNLCYRTCSFGMAFAFFVLIRYFIDCEDCATMFGLPAILLGEGLALMFFGLAWMVKGRFWFGWLDSD